MCFTCVLLPCVFKPIPLCVPCLIPCPLPPVWLVYFSFLPAPCLLGCLNLLAILRMTSCFQPGLKIFLSGFCLIFCIWAHTHQPQRAPTASEVPNTTFFHTAKPGNGSPLTLKVNSVWKGFKNRNKKLYVIIYQNLTKTYACVFERVLVVTQGRLFWSGQSKRLTQERSSALEWMF